MVTLSNELTASNTLAMNLVKLTAFLPVGKAMLDLGPVWLDRYVRAVLADAAALGLEEGLINGTGKDMPIGMVCHCRCASRRWSAG